MSQYMDPTLLLNQPELNLPINTLKRKARNDEMDYFQHVDFEFDDKYEFELRQPYPSPQSSYPENRLIKPWAMDQQQQIPAAKMITIPRLLPVPHTQIDHDLARLIYSPVSSKQLLPKQNAQNPVQLPPKKRAREHTVTNPENLPVTHITSDCGTRIWVVIKSLGKGGCGEVYLCSESTSIKPKELVAVKVIKERKQFVAELSTMKALSNHVCGRGFTPQILYACKKQKAIVMEVLSDSLTSKFDQMSHRFTLKTIIMLAMNMVLIVN